MRETNTTEADLLHLVEAFRVAFHRIDADALRTILSDDFVWHMHYNAAPPAGPTGKVLHGVEALVDELRRRRAEWQDVRFEGLEERAVPPDRILQTFSAKGTDEQGNSFHVNVVDLYDVSNGKISKKDTYWKGLWSYVG